MRWASGLSPARQKLRGPFIVHRAPPDHRGLRRSGRQQKRAFMPLPTTGGAARSISASIRANSANKPRQRGGDSGQHRWGGNHALPSMPARVSTGFRFRRFTIVFSGWSAPACSLTATISMSPAACSRRSLQTKFSTLPQNLQFMSLTFLGMTIGSLVTGFVGDKFGRRFTYQINLLIFGLASLAAAFAQDMPQLIICRFIQGLGLGAEIVVGYSTLTEFVPPTTRGRWLVVHGLSDGVRFPGDRDPRLSDHSELRLAADVRHRRYRLADRLVSAQEPSRIAALAGEPRPHGGGRRPAADD